MFCHWYPTSLNKERLGQCSLIRPGWQPNREKRLRLLASKRSGARIDGTVNICELLINVVIADKPKALIGLNQKVRGQAQGLFDFLTQM
jgi:hypothetical protein